MPLWHEDCFELKVIKKRLTQQELCIHCLHNKISLYISLCKRNVNFHLSLSTVSHSSYRKEENNYYSPETVFRPGDLICNTNLIKQPFLAFTLPCIPPLTYPLTTQTLFLFPLFLFPLKEYLFLIVCVPVGGQHVSEGCGEYPGPQ